MILSFYFINLGSNAQLLHGEISESCEIKLLKTIHTYEVI